MLAAATSFFSRSNISQNYTFGPSPTSIPSSRSGTPVPSSSSTSNGTTASGSTLPAIAHAPPFQVGLWKVQSATHKTTGKRVSVWAFEKRGQEVERMGPGAREKTVEVLKSEVRVFSSP